MPTKKTKTHKVTHAKTRMSPMNIFTEDRTKLQLIIIAFLALSALFVTYFIKQQEQISIYKEAMALTQPK